MEIVESVVVFFEFIGLIIQFIHEVFMPYIWRVFFVFPGAVVRKIVFLFSKSSSTIHYYFKTTPISSGMVGLVCYALLGFLMAWG